MWTFILNEIKAIQFWEVMGLICLLGLGFGILNLLLRGKHKWYSWSLAIPTGFGIATTLMTFFGYFGIPIDSVVLKTTMILLFAGLLVGQYFMLGLDFKNLLRIRPGNWLKRNSPFSITALVFNLLVATILIILFLKSIFWQPISWDVLTSFDLNAKAIANEGKLIHSLTVDSSEIGVGVAYTPMISMSFAYLYLFGFEFPKIYPPLILISFSFLFYFLIKKATNRLWASILTLCCLLTPEFISHGAICQTNLSVALFAFAAGGALYLWSENKFLNRYLYLAYLMAFLASWTRSEGFIVIGAIWILSALIYFKQGGLKKNIMLTSLSAFISFLPFVSWQIFQKVNSEIFEKFTQATIKLSNLTFWNIEKLKVLQKYTSKHTLEFNIFGITFYLFWVLLALVTIYLIYQYVKTKKINWDASIVAAIFGLFLWFAYVFLLYQMTFLRNLDEQVKELDNVSSHSYKRFLFIVVPFAWYFIATNPLSRSISQRLNTFLYGSRAK